MKADPDFHPVAAAWIEGTATPPEQRLLDELLANGPDAVEDYSALCRTEALLHQAGRTAAERRKSLAAMLSGKPWPQRAAGFLMSRSVRWAAAAMLAIATWALWPSAAPEENQAAQKNRVSPLLKETPTAGLGANRTGRDDPLPPAADGLEQRLRRCYVSNFKAAGPLSEAAAALAKAILPGPDNSVTANVLDPGDAPVHLQLPASLPAWTLLQMMAVQSGTDFHLSGHSLVFRTGRKPVPREGSLTRTSELTPLRTLFGIKEKENHPDELLLYSGLTLSGLGSDIEFNLASESSAQSSGTPRDVRVLDLALSATDNPPVHVHLSMIAVEIQPGVEIGDGTQPDGLSRAKLAGIFTDQQFQLTMRSLSQKQGVDFLTLPATMARPGQETKFQTDPGRRGMVAMVIASPAEDGTCDVHCDLGWGVGLPNEGAGNGGQAVNTQVLLWSGQTLGLSGLKGENGSDLLIYITATVVQPDGTPLSPLDKAPNKPDAGATPPPSNATPPPGALLYAIPVVGEKGKVYSPYAPDKGFVDVEGLKRGTRVQCPYTGKHFRVP